MSKLKKNCERKFDRLSQYYASGITPGLPCVELHLSIFLFAFWTRFRILNLEIQAF